METVAFPRKSTVWLAFLVLSLALAVGCGSTSSSSGAREDASTPDDVSQRVEDTQVEADLVPDVPQSSGRQTISDSLEYVELKGLETSVIGLSKQLQFSIDENTVSFMIEVLGEPGVLYQLGEMIDPNGDALVVSSSDPSFCVECKNRVAGAEGVAAFLFPNTTDVTLAPGNYTFRVSSIKIVGEGGVPSSGKFDLVIYFYKKAQRPVVGTIDLNFHFTGAGGITVANAQTNQKFLNAVAEFKTIYAQVGISVGEVRVRDVGDTYKHVESLIGADNDFSNLVALSKDNARGVNIFLVSSITDSSQSGGYGVILGVSGGIPGPTMDVGTRRSGVVVVVEKSFGYNGEFGAVMAHETGHFLGLFHSSEAPFLKIHDPIPDTKENDYTNLMFYAGDLYVQDASAGNKLTPGQGFVMLSNPIVHLQE
ncbi:MAG: hypothetical protein KC609_15150 [Myxococcales bacterium]|nr:hypothetical protein [Myxococcales bacterium]